jgi:hypothetical protein
MSHVRTQVKEMFEKGSSRKAILTSFTGQERRWAEKELRALVLQSMEEVERALGVVVTEARPEDDTMAYPSYHEMLAYMCEQLEIPGSPDFKGAVEWVRKQLAEKKVEKTKEHWATKALTKSLKDLVEDPRLVQTQVMDNGVTVVGYVWSKKFEKIPDHERQRIVWGHLLDTMSESEGRRVEFVFTNPSCFCGEEEGLEHEDWCPSRL